jgi:hypothetical protein
MRLARARLSDEYGAKRRVEVVLLPKTVETLGEFGARSLVEAWNVTEGIIPDAVEVGRPL